AFQSISQSVPERALKWAAEETDYGGAPRLTPRQRTLRGKTFLMLADRIHQSVKARFVIAHNSARNQKPTSPHNYAQSNSTVWKFVVPTPRHCGTAASGSGM